MSEKKRKPYSEKHDPDFRPDPSIEKALRKGAANQELSCALAFKIAEDLRVEPHEVGRTADVLDIRIVKCQLGLFGYKPDKKIVTAEDAPNQEIEEALTKSSEDDRMSCEKVFQIAAQFNMSKLTISNVCQGNLIQIKSCQLGAF
jgi:hypothetical protein